MTLYMSKYVHLSDRNIKFTTIASLIVVNFNIKRIFAIKVCLGFSITNKNNF